MSTRDADSNEPMPEVYDGKVYGYKDAVILGEFYSSDSSDAAYFYDANAPDNEPWEVAYSGGYHLVMGKAQARFIRDRLNEILED